MVAIVCVEHGEPGSPAASIEGQRERIHQRFVSSRLPTR